MIVLEFKLKGRHEQYRVIDDMIRTAQFIRNKAPGTGWTIKELSSLTSTNNVLY
ncbi:hypothetical protein NC997_23055 [Trichocoleus sp. DQ-A2]